MKNFGWLPGSEYGSRVYSVPDEIFVIDDPVSMEPVYLEPPWICDQGPTSACVGNAVQGAIGCQLYNQGDTAYAMSRLFAYYFSRKYHSDVITDNGTYIKTVLHAIRKYGIPLEEHWPYVLDMINEQPSLDAMVMSDNLRGLSYYELPEDNEAYDTYRCLANGMPVVFGAYINQEFMNTDGIEILEPAKNGDLTGGHAMYCNGFGYLDRSFYQLPYFNVVSSWGKKFGNNGTCRVSPDFIEQCQDLSIIHYNI